MDVETTDKQTMDGTLSSNGKDGVSRSKATSSSAIARTLKLSGVELKIVGETLGILKDYKESFDLVCVAEGDACRITFRKGVRCTHRRVINVDPRPFQMICPSMAGNLYMLWIY